MAALPPLGIAALRLRNNNTPAYDEFVGQLEDYYNTLCRDLIAANQTDILAAQGRAQAIGALLRTLKECHLKRPDTPSPARSP